jgi:outer membrane protein assembly factor BamA/autotransporter translocation and assembly factor TamB
MVRVWVRRGLIVPAAIAAGALLAALLAVHTPWARGRALTWASDFVTRFDLTLRANDLGYNALTRRITLTDVRLAAKGHDDRPFLIASRIEVTLPWTVFRGRFAIDHLTIDNGIVDIYRDANDVVNLPPGSNRPTPETPRRLNLRGLTLRGLDVQYADMMRDWGVKVPQIESNLVAGLTGAEGAFAVRGPLAVRLRERTMTLAPFETVMTFDGSDVSLKDARLVSSELNAFLSGEIRRVLDAPHLELGLKGTVDLQHATRWVPPPPVPVSGLVTIEGTIAGPTRNFVTALRVSSNTLAVGRERGLTLAGPVQATFESFSGTQLSIVPVSGGEIRADFNVPWGRAVASKATASWRGLDAQAALDLANVTQQPIAAGFDGSGTFEFGTPARFEITNRAAGRTKPRHVPVTGTVRATIVGDDYRFDHDHRLPGVEIEGRMAGRINRETALLSTMTGPAHARVSDVATAANSLATLGFPVPEIAAEVHGALEVPMTLAGSYRQPQVDTRVTGDAVDVPLLGRVRAAAHIVADTRRADITEVDVRQGSTTITGEAVADVTGRTWTGRFTVDAPRAEELQGEVAEAWRVAGPVQATAILGGTFDHYTLDTTISGTALTWAGQPIDRATAKAIVTGTDIDVTSLELRQGAGFLDGRIRYAWETGAYTAKLKGDRLSWRGSVLAPNDTQAQFSMQFDGTGTTAQPRGRASVDFSLAGGDAGTLIGAGDLTADLMGDQARVVARLPSIGALVNADIATASPYDYRATAVLDRLELARLAPFIDAVEAEILGFANGIVTASGRLADARDRVAIINLTELDAGIGGVPVTLNAPATVALRGDDVTLKDLNVRIGSGRLTASGEWNTKLNGTFQGQFAGDFQDAIRMGRAVGVPVTFDGSGPINLDLKSNGSRAGTLATLTLKAGTFNWGGGPHAVTNLNVDAVLQGESLTVSRLSGDVASGGVVGSFAATARADVPLLELEAISGELIVDAAKFTFSGIPVEQQRPSRVEFSRGAMAVADVSWSVANNPLVLGGSVGFAAEDPPLNLSVQGLVDLRVLSAFVSTLAFDGNANLNALIEGTVSRPLLDGALTLQNAEVALSEPRVVLSELNGPILLDGQRLVFDGIRGLANGGALALDGTLLTEGVNIVGGAIDIQAQGVAIELIRGLRSEVDALVSFRPDPKAPSVTGDIRVVQSSYTETITLASLARRSTLPVSPTAQSPYLDRLRLNLAVTTSEDMTVDNNYGRLEAGANLRVVGTVAQPGMDGRITLREGGEIYLAGRTFRITRGDISFTDLRHIHPEFNIAAEAPLGGGNNATMTLTGTLERPTIDLTSEDGSQTPEELASQLVGQVNTDTAITLLSADLLGATGRAIGLDTVRVEQTTFEDRDFRDSNSVVGNDRTDPTTRLTLSKRLSNQVEFTVSQNLRESGQTTYIVSYFVTRNVELRAVSRDDSTASLGIRHQISFGGGEKRAPSERRVRPKVSTITFVGVEPAIEKEVRDQMSLDPGDNFDFLVLQRDVDRVRDRFKAQGFFEARVRTRRIEESETTTVALEYRVDRGPRTVLEVVGATLPPALIEELEEAWHRNTFDQFLIDDLTHRVRRHLVTLNELGSVVVGTLSRPDPATKRLLIEVTPGVTLSGREIRFTGNQELATTLLQAQIVEAGLTIEGWLDRTVVEQLLVTAYNEAGFLKAQVTGKPLTIDGDIGVLAFEIVEGPRAQVTMLKFAGIADQRLPALQKAAALQTPAPYVASDIDAARSRVEEHYRDEGFNAAAIEVEPAIADDDTVTLTFAVTEGVQQVLQQVEPTGLDVTRGTVMTEALRFELGKPVNLDEWALARKRLYDTNVFRLVEIQPVPIGDAVNGVQPVKARVAVEEYPEWSFRYGFQIEGDRNEDIEEFTSARNLGVVAELKTSNLFGRALTFGAFGMYQNDSRDATLFLATSRLFGWRARSSLYGYYQRDLERNPEGEQEILYTQDTQGVSADQRWRLRGAQIVYGYRFERTRTRFPALPNDPVPFDFISNLATLNLASLLDRRDDPLSPRKGTFSSISLDNSALWLGSDVRNLKLLAQQYAFVPLSKIVLATRVQAGKKFGPDALLPDDRFRAGGATSVRGYSEDALGPRGLGGIPEGGESMFVFNQELRVPLHRWFSAVAFVDAGEVFGKDETTGQAEAFDLGALKVGYGAGLRVNSPVGILRVDFGIPTTNVSQVTVRGVDWRKARWYFGIGHIF